MPKGDRKEQEGNTVQCYSRIFSDEKQNRQITILIAKINCFLGRNWFVYNSVNLYALCIGTFDYDFGNLR